MSRSVTFPTAVVLTLWCVVHALTSDTLAGPQERVEFEGAPQRLISGGLILGDRIRGYLAKPEGTGPFPAVIGLHGCAGMPDATKQKLVDELVGWGYVVLLVDSFATRGIEHACTGGFPLIADMRRSDAYGALAFLARQSFVDQHRVAAVGFSQGGWVSLLVAEANSLELFVRPNNLIDKRGAISADRREKLHADALDLIATKGFRAVIALYPVCRAVAGRLVIPTLILIGALDQWTPAADCSEKIDAWRTDAVPIELVVYPGVHHSFYYRELQPGRTMFGHWLEYNAEAAADASRRMREFLKRHLK
jgi:dienelactone hydrolase